MLFFYSRISKLYYHHSISSPSTESHIQKLDRFYKGMHFFFLLSILSNLTIKHLKSHAIIILMHNKARHILILEQWVFNIKKNHWFHFSNLQNRLKNTLRNRTHKNQKYVYFMLMNTINNSFTLSSDKTLMVFQKLF